MGRWEDGEMGRWGASHFCKKHFFTVLSPLACFASAGERGQHYKGKTEMQPND